jgi:hypothetical protein
LIDAVGIRKGGLVCARVDRWADEHEIDRVVFLKLIMRWRVDSGGETSMHVRGRALGCFDAPLIDCFKSRKTAHRNSSGDIPDAIISRCATVRLLGVPFFLPPVFRPRAIYLDLF